uniref:STPR domain-containing protein n=1 Tax=Amphimedon queenslandica TaxID=400682 RepID=A0A1X7VS34_AMPQE
MNPHQRKSHLNNKRLRSQLKCANESEAQREARLDDQRQRSQQRCANESEAQREARLIELNQRSQQRLASESELEREVHLLDPHQRDCERRDSETEEQRAQRNIRIRKLLGNYQLTRHAQLTLLKVYVSNNCKEKTSINIKKKYDYL